MNVIWRSILIVFLAYRRRRRTGRLPLESVTRVRLTTLPTDIDVAMHMNNGRYLSLFDLGRWDLLVRTGVMDDMTKRGWYAVVSSETITFRKSLNLWQRFDIESRIIGYDDKGIFMEHRAVVKGEIYARAIVRSRILRRAGGTVPHEEIFEAIGRPENLPDVADWVHDWVRDGALPPRAVPAPSTWPDEAPAGNTADARHGAH